MLSKLLGKGKLVRDVSCKCLILSFFCLFLVQCAEESKGLPDVVDFNYHIRPILSQNCYTCHGPDASSRKGGLRLDTEDGSRERLASGSRTIVPGSLRRSTLLSRIQQEDPDLTMPPPETKKKLTQKEIDLLEKWIDQGAKWKKHWSFIVPNKRKLEYASIDEYIEKQILNIGLEKSEAADKESLIRRISYITTGLPPSVQELKDLSSKPHEDVVDYFLASEHFGEHWARHWMDLVRYAEGMGHEFDFTIGGASHYRDYLIRAFNQDLPYDQFIKEHLAGDLLEKPRINEDLKVNESAIGTAYAFLGEGKHSPVDIKQEEADRMDNLIDVTSKTFQGLTVSCARCHDHKFDPIPTTDYYAMYGMFESSRTVPISFNTLDFQKPIDKESLRISEQIKSDISDYISEVQYVNEEDISDYLGDFRQSSFGEWRTTGHAFGMKPYLGQFASSRSYRSGIIGTLSSPNFTIQDSFLYVYAAGKASTIRVIVDNFQLIQNPLYGQLSRKVDKDEWTLYKMNLSALIGHKAYVQIIPGNFNRHHYQIDSTDYVDVQYVFTSDARIKLQKDTIEQERKDSLDIHTHFARLDSLRDSMIDHRYVMGMTDGNAVFSPVFIRGSHKERSEEKVAHQFISAISEGKPFSQKGSGRLEWAEAVADPDNPLTARVMANRVWHHIFGTGLVTSVDNFGLQGSLPSNPQLLDYLAISFVEKGWSVKSLVKEILMSETFRRSTKLIDENLNKDPENKFLASFPIRRLEAESIRDGLLAISGTLDRQMYDESVPIHLTEFMTGRGRPSVSGPLDGNGRRSIYTSIKRNFLSPMMQTFDMPIPFSTFGRRNITNVPAQSLFLMNDPLVHEQSAKWASRILENDLSSTERIKLCYLQAFSRKPSEEEVASGLRIIAELINESELDAWTNFCHILINTKEFIHLV